jgi:hypothetical protein
VHLCDFKQVLPSPLSASLVDVDDLMVSAAFASDPINLCANVPHGYAL